MFGIGFREIIPITRPVYEKLLYQLFHRSVGSETRPEVKGRTEFGKSLLILRRQRMADLGT